MAQPGAGARAGASTDWRRGSSGDARLSGASITPRTSHWPMNSAAAAAVTDRPGQGVKLQLQLLLACALSPKEQRRASHAFTWLAHWSRVQKKQSQGVVGRGRRGGAMRARPCPRLRGGGEGSMQCGRRRKLASGAAMRGVMGIERFVNQTGVSCMREAAQAGAAVLPQNRKCTSRAARGPPSWRCFQW